MFHPRKEYLCAFVCICGSNLLNGINIERKNVTTYIYKCTKLILDRAPLGRLHEARPLITSQQDDPGPLGREHTRFDPFQPRRDPAALTQQIAIGPETQPETVGQPKIPCQA